MNDCAGSRSVDGVVRVQRLASSRRWIRWWGIVAGVTVLLSVGSIWLAAGHTPSWYHPPTLTKIDLRRIRADLPNRYQAFTDLLAEGIPFEFVLTAVEINEWLAARADLWPDAREWIPDSLHDPVVAFRGGRVVVGARIDQGVLRAIVSLHLSIRLADGTIQLRVARVASGSLPIPNGIAFSMMAALVGGVEDQLKSELRRVLDAHSNMEPTPAGTAVHERIVIPNRFYWANGQRHFRLLDITVGEGVLQLRVEPIGR